MSKEPNRNVYVGHRYVPLILEEWDNKISYEGLSVVTHKGASYTSKKRVPVGIDILNKEFWSLTGNYNTQVDYYRDETERVAEDLLLKSDKTYVDTELNKKANKTYVDTELGKKADTSFVNTELDKKAETSFVNTELGKKSDQTYVDTEIGKKSDKTYVDTELGKKTNNVITENIKKDLESRALNIESIGFTGEGDETDSLLTVLNDQAVYNLIIPFDINISYDVIISDKPNMEITFLNNAKIIADGCSGLEFINCQGLRINNYSSKQLERNWNANHSGLIITDSSNAKITVNRIEGFHSGLHLRGLNGGVAYSTFFIDSIYNNKKGVHLQSEGRGWVTELELHGGRYSLMSELNAVTTDTWAIYGENSGSYASNNIRIYSPSFESLENGIMGSGPEWLIMHPRFEGIKKDFITGTLGRSTILVGYGGFDTDRINMTSASRNIAVVGYVPGKESSFHTIGGDYSGYSFLNKNDLETLGELKYRSNRKTIALTDTKGISQPFNKQYESVGEPTEGTYHSASVIWNLSPNIGSPMGWIVRYSGTFGNLEGATITTTAGSRWAKVNNINELSIGDHLRISGSTYIVQEKEGDQIYLDSNVSETLNNFGYNYFNPTILKLPDIPTQ